MHVSPFVVRAPGRLCLFGEHSDYLGLDVIAGAIDLSVTMKVQPRRDSTVTLWFEVTGERDTFSLDEPISYRHGRDYVRAAFRVAQRAGLGMTGADITVSGDIPLSSGLSSSSALTVAAILACHTLARAPVDPMEVAHLAFQAEVVEFEESGGMMDHSASAFGGLLHISFASDVTVSALPAVLDGLVIGDCGLRKRDTVGDLKRIRRTIERGYEALAEAVPGFDPRTTPVRDILDLADAIPKSCRRMTIATLKNRDLTARALALLRSPHPDPVTLGNMIDEHHAIMRDGLGVSIREIDELIAVAREAGALGCKINGSGRGGTMLAYAPGREVDVMRAMEEAGSSAYRVRISRGAHTVRDSIVG